MNTKELAIELRRIAVSIEKMLVSLNATNMEATTDAEKAARIAKGLCLHCGEPFSKVKTKPTRGCHEHCKKQLLEIMTEEEAMRLNRLLPAKSGGRPPGAPSKATLEAVKDVGDLRGNTNKTKRSR